MLYTITIDFAERLNCNDLGGRVLSKPYFDQFRLVIVIFE